MEHSCLIANYFVNKSLSTGKNITPLQLVKLVYLAHGWHLGLTEEPLLVESVEAWRYGPVVPSVYHGFKKYGTDKITSLLISDEQNLIPNFDETSFLRELLDKTWEIYSDYTGLELSALTHEEGTPWDTVWNKEGGSHRKSASIPNNIIKEYYKKKAEENEKENKK